MNKQEKIDKLKKEMNTKCVHNIKDGAGNYCLLFPSLDKDYPHKFRRIDCYGRKHNCVYPKQYKLMDELNKEKEA